MGTLLSYCLQVVVSSGILYSYYHVALRNKRFHQYNRFYLLGITVVSLLVPFLEIPVYFSSADEPVLLTLQTLPVFITGSSSAESAGAWTFDGIAIVYLVYALIAGIFLTRLLLSLIKLKRIVKNNPVEELKGVYFVRTDEPGTPFSFFRWLFWDNKIELGSPKGDQVFRHEIFHIQQRHSRDIIFIELVSMICWFNPFFYFIKKELKAIHEFLADRFAASESEKWEYAELLLMQALNTKHSIVNPFFHNQIKRRIAMITKPQTTKHQYLRKLLVLPVAALTVSLFAFQYKARNEPLQLVPTNISPLVVEEKIVNDTVPKTTTVRLSAGKKDNAPKQGTTNLMLQEMPDSAQPLYVINEVVQPRSQDAMKKINPDQISRINVLKGDKAVEKYGADARNGVLEITTKDKEKAKVFDAGVVELKAVPALTDKLALQGVVINEVTIRDGDGPAFPGGTSEWRKYLTKNLDATIPLKNGAAVGAYTVWVQFIVDRDGKLGDIKALTNHGFGMEEEVVRLLKNSPDWISATQDGQRVKAYKKQPVTFQITDDNSLDEVVATASKTQMKEVTITGGSPRIYPNPSGNNATLQLRSTEAGEGTITVTDLKGKVLSTTRAGLMKGNNTLSVVTGSFAKGLYIVSVLDANKTVIGTYKLVKE